MRVRLLQGERVIIRTRPNPLPLVGPLLLGFAVLAVGGFGLGYLTHRELGGALADWQPVLLAAVAAAVGLLLLRTLVVPVARWSGNRYVLTNLRLIHRRGVTRRTEHQIDLPAIGRLRTEQRLLQRPMGSGTLVVDLGYGGVHHYPDVPRVAMFRDYVAQAISELPLTRMFDGVDMGADPQYTRSGMPRPAQDRAQQEWRGERG